MVSRAEVVSTIDKSKLLEGHNNSNHDLRPTDSTYRSTAAMSAAMAKESKSLLTADGAAAGLGSALIPQ